VTKFKERADSQKTHKKQKVHSHNERNGSHLHITVHSYEKLPTYSKYRLKHSISSK